MGMDAPGARVAHERQFVGIGAFELPDPAIIQDELGERVIQGELRQGLLGGRGLAFGGTPFDGQLEVGKEDLLDLGRRIEIEGGSSKLMGGDLQGLQGLGELGAVGLQHRAIDRNTVGLDARQHRGQGPFDVPIDRGKPRLFRKTRHELFVQLAQALHRVRRHREDFGRGDIGKRAQLPTVATKRSLGRPPGAPDI